MGGRIKGPSDEDREVASGAPPDTASKLWARARLGYTREVRELVDGMVADGGMSFVDVLSLHLADYTKLRAKVKRLERQPRTHSVQAELESASLQHLKGMRSVLVAMNPTGSPNERRHPVPAEKVTATLERLDRAITPAADTGTELN